MKHKPWSLHLRRRFQFACWLWLLLPATIPAQSLTVPSVTAAPGERITVEISLDSPAGKEPVILQWEVTIPAGQLSFVDHTPPAGPALRDAGKSVACTVKLVRPKDGDRFTLLCIAAGGLKPIPSGVVAPLRLQVSPEAQMGPLQVRVEGASVDKEATETSLKPIETAVRVQAK